MARPMTGEELADFLGGDAIHTAKLATTHADGRPHVAPVWFVLDRSSAAPDNPIGDIVLNTGAETVKGKGLRRDPRVCLCVDDERPPHSFAVIDGIATLSEDLDEVRHWATVIGGRYLGEEHAVAIGERNGVPGELLVRVRPTRITAMAELAD